MAFRFPFSTLHELNLDWILEQVKKFSELIPHMENVDENVQYAVDTANEAMSMIEQAVTVVPCDSDPVMDGTATAGELNEFSRGDHVHPSDTSKVSKTGDTMTGMLNLINNSLINVKTNIPTSIPEESAFAQGMMFNDAEDNWMGYIEAQHRDDGAKGVDVTGYRNISEVAHYNGMQLLLDASGSPIVYLTAPSAWLSALNAINKSGDTMNGNLTILNSNNPTLTIKNPDMDNTAQSLPASEVCSINFADNQNNIIAFINANETTSGTSILTFGVRKNVSGTDVDNTFSLSVNKDGVKSVTFSDVNAWRTALGIT